MKKTSKFIAYFLAFILPFGSINPFNLSAVKYVDSYVGNEQMGFAPILFAICCLLALFDTRIYKHNRKMKKFLWPLGILFAALASASVINVSESCEFPTMYLLKFMAVEGGFYIMALYFTEYPQTLKSSMLIYAYTCVAIILAYFAGLLDDFGYVSKGRLWLFGENPNTFSFLMSLGAIILTNKFNQGNRMPVLLKTFDIIGITLLLLYIVLSGSRGSFLIVIICITILLFTNKIARRVYVTIPVVVIAFALGYQYYNSHQDEISIFNRFANTEEDERIKLQEQSIELFLEKPLLGHGVNGYKNQMWLRYHDSRDSHNVVITTTAMSGIVGGFSLSLFLLFLLRISWRNRDNDMLGIVVCIDVLLMSMKTGGVLTFAMMWYTYATVVAMSYSRKI